MTFTGCSPVAAVSRRRCRAAAGAAHRPGGSNGSPSRTGSCATSTASCARGSTGSSRARPPRAEPAAPAAFVAAVTVFDRLNVADAKTTATCNEYDVIVIGAGTGGYVAAIRAAQLGLKVAVVEKQKALGGTCLLWGCIPTKALLEHAHALKIVQHAKEWGVTTRRRRPSAIDMAAGPGPEGPGRHRPDQGRRVPVQEEQDRLDQGHGPADRQRRRRGLRRRHADAARAQGDHRRHRSAPRSVPGIEIDRKRIITSDEAIGLREVPKSIAILGSGAVGVEFASIFSRFGSEVTILELLPRLVPVEDEAVSAELEKSFRKQGITSHTGARVTSAQVDGDGVDVDGAARRRQHADDSRRLPAGGHRPRAGDRRPRRRSASGCSSRRATSRSTRSTGPTCPGISAIGDVITLGDAGASAARARVVGRRHRRRRADCRAARSRPLNYDHVPGCTYCDPEIGSVGLTEREAQERGLRRPGRHVPVRRARPREDGGRDRRVREDRRREEVRRSARRPHDRPALDRARRRSDAGAAARVHGRGADPHDSRASRRWPKRSARRRTPPTARRYTCRSIRSGCQMTELDTIDTMATDVVMPQMGESIAEGTIVRWIKKVGDTVERDEPLFEISTDKVDAEIPSPVAGVRRRDPRQGRRDGPGQQRRRGDRSRPARSRRRAAGGAGRAAAAAEQQRRRQLGAAVGGAPPPAQRAGGAAAAPSPTAALPRARRGAAAPQSAEEALRQRSSPLVRRIAKEHNVDISQIRGTGIAGRVTKDDILGFIARGRRGRRRCGRQRRGRASGGAAASDAGARRAGRRRSRRRRSPDRRVPMSVDAQEDRRAHDRSAGGRRRTCTRCSRSTSTRRADSRGEESRVRARRREAHLSVVHHQGRGRRAARRADRQRLGRRRQHRLSQGRSTSASPSRSTGA